MKRLLILSVFALTGFTGTAQAQDTVMMERMITTLERLEARIARLEARSNYQPTSYSTVSLRQPQVMTANYSRQQQIEREVEQRAVSEFRSSNGTRVSYGTSCGLSENEGVFQYNGYRVRFVVER